VPARRCGRVFHVENNGESTQQSGHIKIWKKIKAYLKRQSRTYKSKKAKVLEKEHIEEFLLNASNSEHLMTKVIKF
jgi:hypothetical protein